MASCTAISLPWEVIVYILKDNQLSFTDVINFSLTCKHFHKIVSDSDELWKSKFFQRWPLLKEVYQSSSETNCCIKNWKEEVKANVIIRRKLLKHVALLSSLYFAHMQLAIRKFEVLNPSSWLEEGAHPLTYYFLVDELISLIKRPIKSSNLTHRYYALMIVYYLKKRHLTKEWQRFKSLPRDKQIFEYGATIVAQWNQPEEHVSYSQISLLLDNIADQSKQVLKEKYPNHSLFLTPEEKFTFWKHNAIHDNQWSVLETRQITDALCKVLFEKLGFYGNSQMYYTSESSFIDQVLRKRYGNSITLAIIFESVARRLGVRCEPMSFPSHFLLRWKENYGPDSENEEDYYIDVLNSGQFLTKKDCLRIAELPSYCLEKYNYKPATVRDTTMKLAHNLETAFRQYSQSKPNAKLTSVLELQFMILSTEVSDQVYSRRLLELVVRAKMNPLVLNTEPQLRLPSVKYAVGLIMKHRLDENLCLITGWETKDTKFSLMDFTNANDLEEGPDQPFYITFMNNGSCKYIPQEHLSLAPSPKWINNNEIGKYFCAFRGTHYEPNEELAYLYPGDEEVRSIEVRQAYPNWSTNTNEIEIDDDV